MPKLYEIYKCDVCGNITEVVHGGKAEMFCCGKPMTLQVILTVYFPSILRLCISPVIPITQTLWNLLLCQTIILQLQFPLSTAETL